MDRPAEYLVLEHGDDVLLRDDQVLTLHRVLMRGRLQTYLRALRGSLWWHIFDLRDVLAGSLSAELDVQLSDQPARDQRGIVLFALRAAFASVDACTAAIGRAAIVVPLEAAPTERPEGAAFTEEKESCCCARTAGTGAATTSSRCVARAAAAAASCVRHADRSSGRARAT
jgi:hypothetical protein